MSACSKEQLDELLVNVLGKATVSDGDKGMIHDLLLEHGRELEARIVREATMVRVRNDGGGWKVEGWDRLNWPLLLGRMDRWGRDNLQDLLQMCHVRIGQKAMEVWDHNSIVIQACIPVGGFLECWGRVRFTFGVPRKQVTVCITHYTLRRPLDRPWFKFHDEHGLLSDVLDVRTDIMDADEMEYYSDRDGRGDDVL